MALPEHLTEYLNIKKVEMAAETLTSDKDMKAYVVIIPLEEARVQQYKSNLLPIVSYEVRFIKHKAIYTEEMWGYDYDCVLADSTTRIQRMFINRTNENAELEELLHTFPIDIAKFDRVSSFDSALLNSPIDCYFENTTEFPHLGEN